MANELDFDIKRKMKEIRNVLKSVQGEEQKEILDLAGQIVVDKAKGFVKIGKARRGVLQGAASATYSKGEIKSRYFPKNLQRSLQILKLRKTDNVIIGPKIARKETKKKYGTSDANASAYYAQMIFGSAEAFQRRVTGAALDATRSRVITVIEREVNKRISSAKKRNNLD